jgi:hypothetical protein
MKITDPQVIETGEKKLISAIHQHLDPETVKTILMDRMAESAFESRGGQIVVHDNQIAFRLDFDLKLSGSLLFDRQGNYIGDVSGPSFEAENDPAEPFDKENGEYSDLLLDDEFDDEKEDVREFSPEDTDDIDDILNESQEFWNRKKEP